MNNVNQFLLKRKIQKINLQKNKTLKLKKNFKKLKQNYSQVEDYEKNEKVKEDILFDKKKKFYDEIFTENNEIKKISGKEKITKDNIIPEDKQEKYNNAKPLPYLKEIKNDLIKKQKTEKEKAKIIQEKNREKNLVKKVFKERTSKNQPVMKNYMNYLLYKIENNK